MAGTISQTLHRLHIGRGKKTADVKTENAESPSADHSGGGGPDSSVSSGMGITPSGSPDPVSAAAYIKNDQEVDEKPVIEKRSSWPFQFSKHKRASSKELPQEFVCPISKSLMVDPVIVASGESYERQCIHIWLRQGNRHCFKTGQTLEHQCLTPNIALRSAIQTWCEKHKISKPQAPTVESATQLVESSVRTAFVSDSSGPPTPSSTIDDARPGFSSDTARPGFGNNETPEPYIHSSGNSGSYEQSPGNSGSYGQGTRWQSPGGSGSYEQGGEHYQNQWRQSGDLEPAEHAGQPTWASRQDNNGPLWKRRYPATTTKLRSSGSRGSRESSREFDRRTSPTNYNGNSGNDISWQGSSVTDGSSEWPAATRFNRYVQSASGDTLREDVEDFHGRGKTPLPLETTPSSYEGGEDGQHQEGRSTEGELIHRLSHPQPLEQEEAAAEVRRLTRNTEPGIDYRLALCTPDLLAALIPLLQSRYAGVQVNAAAAIMNLSLANENKIKVARVGAIPCLVDILKGRYDAAQEHAAGALFSLALNDENKMAIGVLGAIPPLIHVLRVGPLGTQRDAAMALYHLSFAHINRGKLIKAGGVPILLQLVQEASPDLVSRALLILCNLAVVQEGRSAICEAHGISVFVGLLSAGMDSPLSQTFGPDGDTEPTSRGGDDWASVREHAAAALLQLSNQNMRFKGQALQAGAIEPLAALQECGTPRAQDKARALLNILRDIPNQHSESQGGALYSRGSHRRSQGGGNSAQF